jgi:hypothetical protein
VLMLMFQELKDIKEQEVPGFTDLLVKEDKLTLWEGLVVPVKPKKRFGCNQRFFMYLFYEC